MDCVCEAQGHLGKAVELLGPEDTRNIGLQWAMVDWAGMSLDGAVEQFSLVACKTAFKMRCSYMNTSRS